MVKMRLLLLSDNRFSITTSLAIYLISFVFGCLLSLAIKTPKSAVPNVFGYNDLTAVSFIKHNLIAASPILLGFITFGLFTLFLLFINGLFFGAALMASLENNSLYQVTLLVLPHDIFEIPAIILAGTAGFKSLEVLLRYLKGGSFIERRDVKDFFKLVFASFILIIIAGVIEANITPIFLPR